ncbi:MAG: AAA family ATPase [Symploca sp. SIO1B1]|nr:AAA family ATPase [Symploca sp. SIO1B1]
MIIAISNQKGGSGKTTTAIHLVTWLKKTQRGTTIFIDTDPQGSATSWLQQMDSDIPYRLIPDANSLIENLPDLDEEYQFVVIDGAAGASESNRAVLCLTDVSVTPIQPTGLDLFTSGETFRLIRQAKQISQHPKVATALLVRAVRNTRNKDQALEVLAEIPDIKCLTSVIHQAQVIADTFTSQSVVWEMGAKAKRASSEYDGAFKEILKLAGGLK